MQAHAEGESQGNGDSNGVFLESAVPAKPTAKKGTIENTYQKKTHLEQILLRPDTYIGSVEHTKQKMWVYDTENEVMIQKELEFVPGLYKIYDEILVNAADNKQRDKSMDCIKIDINQETNTISVWNNGKGIPVVMHKDEKMFVPTMIFGHLLTSSNYNDDEEKVTGGRNGYGAKLCNIFSNKFTVETASKEYKKQYKQVWGSNMSKASEPKIKEFSGEDFTRVTFSPDLTRFKMDKLDDDMVMLMSRRAFDIAASTRGVKVYLNGKKLPIKNFKDYVDLHIKGKEDRDGNPLKVIYETINDRWEVAVTVSKDEFLQVSFVNSIATTKGGRHVDYITDMIVKIILELLKKKNKGGVAIRPAQIKAHTWIFINSLIVNPTFNSQTKEYMTLQPKNFGSKCVLTEKFTKQLLKCAIVDTVLSWAGTKANTELSQVSGKKSKRLNIPKLDDAGQAGYSRSLECTLILTEGDSAKTLAVAGLSVVGRELYGVFPLRGKLLNSREATHKQLKENAEINHLRQILGLDHKKKYNTKEDMKSLRYGKVMIMTDQDQDGSHIKGLLINFIHHNWPELLKQNFLEEFITPIVKAKKRNITHSFYSLPEFSEWKNNTPDHATYAVKYYKGLGTSDSREAKEYFRDMARHRIQFRYSGQQDDDHIILAFSKKHVDQRKEWLTNFMVESKRRKEIGLSEKYLYTKDTKFVSYTDFINLELVLFSNADNVRSIPSLVDGFKPGQRKILFACIKRNDKREVKVAQLAGSVAYLSAYHHGEVSLCMTIVGLAQNFVGSNNINLLLPRGQFGTRLSGGKDSASPRYIFTKLSPLTRLLFHPLDDPLLTHEYDDNKKIEPVWYIPILPMVLVNGADGIGTGWMTKIPNFNPREIVSNLRKLLDGNTPENIIPWYKNFKGTIEGCGDQRYIVSGEIAIIGHDKLEITELPVGTWTQNYKENVLDPMLEGTEKAPRILKDYKEYSTDLTVRFVITCMPGKLEELETQGLHKVFKLQSLINTTSMCAFDELGCLRRFDSVMDMLLEFYTLRQKMYEKRKLYCEGALEAEASKLSFQAKFIVQKCNGEIVVENKKRKAIVEELIKCQYPPDPFVEWKRRVQISEEEEQLEDTVEDEDEEVTDSQPKKKLDDEKSSEDVKKFDYLLGMSMWMLTQERKNELLRQRDNKLAELEALKSKTPSDLWRADLDEFMQKLDDVEEKERAAETQVKQEPRGKGKKTILLPETMPSPIGRRVLPTITDEIKKKISNAVKLRENKIKKEIKKENFGEGENDEFDTMTQSKKTLKDKLGTPEEVEKKVKNRKPKDGLVQSKLNFKPKNGDPKTKGSPKKRTKKKITSDTEDEVSVTDSEVEESSLPVIKERTMNRRAATKVTKYQLSESSDDSDAGEPQLFDNDAIKEESIHQVCMNASSESENEAAPPPKNESSEDLFDSLIGKKDESEESPIKSNPKPPKKRAVSSSESDFGDKIKNNSASDSDFEIKKPQKKKSKKGDSDGATNKNPAKKRTVKDANEQKLPRKKAAPAKKTKPKSKTDKDVELAGDVLKHNSDKNEDKSSPDSSDFGKRNKGQPVKRKVLLSDSESDFSVPDEDSDSDFGIKKQKGKGKKV